jgi:hypothetical protein
MKYYRKKIQLESKIQQDKAGTRMVYDRPDYKKSTWWKMREKGDCKNPNHRDYKTFRRISKFSRCRISAL